MGQRATILLADDEQGVIDTLVALIAREPDLEVVGQALDAAAAIELAARLQPDLAILDVRMPGGGGERAVRGILDGSPETRALALSAKGDVETVLGMLRAGALGFALKGGSSDDLVAAIRRCLNDEAVIAAQVSQELAQVLARTLHGDATRPARHGTLHSRIKRVLAARQVRMVFQPIVNLRTGLQEGVEALARIEAIPRRSPDRWFAEAEEVGLLLPLELEAIRVAAGHVRSFEGLFVSFNVSPRTASSAELADVLRDAPLDRLVLEVTEQAPVEDYEALREVIDPMRDRGLRIAVDDVGAGFASLRHILELRPEIVKIDLSLVRGIDADPDRRAGVTALSSFASRVGADVVAEGVETAEELETLRRLDVLYGQGFFFGRPEPLGTSEAAEPWAALEGAAGVSAWVPD